MPCFSSLLPPFANLSKHHPKVAANVTHLQYQLHSWLDTPIYPVSSVITMADTQGHPMEHLQVLLHHAQPDPGLDPAGHPP